MEGDGWSSRGIRKRTARRERMPIGVFGTMDCLRISMHITFKDKCSVDPIAGASEGVACDAPLYQRDP